MEEFLNSREFYELMYSYRCAPTANQNEVIERFETVKKEIDEIIPLHEQIERKGITTLTTTYDSFDYYINEYIGVKINRLGESYFIKYKYASIIFNVKFSYLEECKEYCKRLKDYIIPIEINKIP